MGRGRRRHRTRDTQPDVGGACRCATMRRWAAGQCMRSPDSMAILVGFSLARKAAAGIAEDASRASLWRRTRAADQQAQQSEARKSEHGKSRGWVVSWLQESATRQGYADPARLTAWPRCRGSNRSRAVRPQSPSAWGVGPANAGLGPVAGAAWLTPESGRSVRLTRP